MKTKIQAIMIMCSVFLSISCVAQNPASCSPVGTWYGGAEVKYLATIIPVTGETFSARFEVVAPLQSIGYSAWTSWSGQFSRAKAGRYIVQYVSMYTNSSAFPPLENSYELDAVHGSMEFNGCDNFTITYDFYGVYFDLNKVPFVGQPAFGGDIPAPGIVETYHRVPNTCPVCGSSVTTSVHGHKKH